ncbi:MAG: CHAT domain-containing protein [Pyrinomonadaceae bacterium]|nr:CHAT domain-containing protein [Pyrinomonadaceae bacterium]
MIYRRSIIRIFFLQILLLLSTSILNAQDDQTLLNAEKKHIEANELFKKNTAESRQTAKKLFLENLSVFENAKDAKRLAETCYRLSDLSEDLKSKLEYLKKAAPLYQQIGNSKAFALMLNNICAFQEQTGNTTDLLPFCLKSVETYREINDKYGEAVALSNLGSAYNAIGQYNKAFESLELSLKIKRELKDRSGEIVTLSTIANLYGRIGEPRKGVSYSKAALEIAEQINDPQRKSLALINHAAGLVTIGEYQKGLDYFQQGLSIARERADKRSEGAALNNLAGIYSVLGENEKAIEYYQRASVLFQELGMTQAEATALSSIGNRYEILGDYEKASEYSQKALEISRRIKDKKGQAQRLVNLGLVNALSGKFEEAIKLGTEGLLLAQESSDKPTLSRTAGNLAYIYYIAKNDLKAVENFETAVKLLRETEDIHELVVNLYRYARLDHYFGRRESAISKMKEVIEITESLRNSFVSQGLRSDYLSQKKHFYDFYIELLFELNREKPKQGFDEAALRISESARARSLLDSLGNLQKDIKGNAPPELLDEISALRQTINFKDSQKLKAVQKNENSKAAELDKEITVLLNRYDELQTKLRQSNPQFASLNNPQPLSLSEIQKQVLDDETVLLEYSIGEKRSFLFFVTNRTLEIFELPRSEMIEKQVRQTLENLKTRGQQIDNETVPQRNERLKNADLEFQKNIEETSKILLSPIADKILNKRLLIVGSGVLQYLPFSTLKNKTRYLIETNEIVNLPSASILPLLRKTKNNSVSQQKEIAILADPIFSNTDSRFKTLAESNKPKTDDKIIPSVLRSDFSRLRFSRVEAENISSLAADDKKHIALDFAANLESVNSEAVRNSRIVHFATHGIVNSKLPELSSIVLSLFDENGKSREGLLRLNDVYNLQLSADLVVMSACETALGKEINGEGIVGLTRGFMFAGAKSVMASLWKVDDRATADLMGSFYQKMLKEGLSPAAALRASQIAMIRQKASANPYYWAAFTIQGDFLPPMKQK